MSFLKYIKDIIISIVIYFFATFLIIVLLKTFNSSNYLIIIISIILFITGLTIVGINFIRKKRFYSCLNDTLKKLDKKFLILETLPDADTYEQKIMVEALYDINKSMIENINQYKKNIIEFKEFVEIWIHEVKIPISSLMLKYHNHMDKYDKSINSILRRLDNNIDEVLYYVRSEETEKDFFISEVDLKDVVRGISIKNKDDLLENNISFEIDLNNTLVFTDKKWLSFIINQIINNSIKYRNKDNSVIKIKSYRKDDSLYLEIYDNGIGIPKKDLNRVFDKSFTGTNGRDRVKSTGMGLYIVNNLCKKLGHKLSIKSVENSYTSVTIEFGLNDMYTLDN